MNPHSSIFPPAPTPTLPDLCRAAATAIETLCATLRDCAREVETRGGQRVARDRLVDDAVDAARWLIALGLSERGKYATETRDMLEGVRNGYVRPTWALRLMQLAADAEPRDTVPAEAPVCTFGGLFPIGDERRCVAKATHRGVDYPALQRCDNPTHAGDGTLRWVRLDDGAPEEHAGEGGT